MRTPASVNRLVMKMCVCHVVHLDQNLSLLEGRGMAMDVSQALTHDIKSSFAFHRI